MICYKYVKQMVWRGKSQARRRKDDRFPMNNKAFFNLSYGVYILSSMDGGRPCGCIANSAMQITAEPATIAVSVNHDNFTNGLIAKTGLFALNILPESTDAALIGTFGFQSGKTIDKFQGVPYEVIGSVPVLEESCGHFICRVINTMETETHTVFLGEVLEYDLMNDTEPMTYDYYHRVIKGRAPKNAPTYLEKEDFTLGEGTRYVCDFCKYEYDGEVPFEELPDDYVCPICGMPKSAFVKE